MSILIISPSQAEQLKADLNWEDLVCSTKRLDFFDDKRGGEWLTKKGKPRKRIKNKTSRWIGDYYDDFQE